MNQPRAFAIRLLSAQTIGTRRALAGTQLMMTAPDAAAAIRAGLARLADDADLPRLIDAMGLRQRAPDGR